MVIKFLWGLNEVRSLLDSKHTFLEFLPLWNSIEVPLEVWERFLGDLDGCLEALGRSAGGTVENLIQWVVG